MMKVLKYVGIGILGIAVLFAGAALTYRLVKRQGVIDPQEINGGETESASILYLTQDRPFKRDVLEAVAASLTGNGPRMQVLDITQVADADLQAFDGLVILGTVQSTAINPELVTLFRENASLPPYIVLLSADSGEWKTPELSIDAIAAASADRNVDDFARRIIAFVREIERRQASL